MNPAIALAADRVLRSRRTLDERLGARLTARAAVNASPDRALEAGARVFDLVTGQEGRVIYGTRENFVVPAPDRRNG